MKILTILGSSAQYIKAAVMSHQFISKGIDEIVLTAGLRIDDPTSSILFDEMDLPEPKYKLNIPDLNPGAVTGKLIIEIESAIILEKPNLVIVYGDSNPALAGAIAARKNQIPVAHIEAGLRSFNLKTPEELNRIIIDRISNILFCPTNVAFENLKNEGFDQFPCKICNSGDIMQDAANHYGALSSIKSDIIGRLNIKQSFALAIVNCPENTNDSVKFSEIVKALNQINRNHRIIAILHPNASKNLKSRGIETNFSIIPPVNYFDLLELLKTCNIVLTDSGEIQKEAFFFGKCCVTLKQETEWTELVKRGFNMLGSSDSEFILIAYQEMMDRKPDFNIDLFGKGKASEKIAEILKNWNG